MSTRSLTRVLDADGTTVATIYVHSDGYPTGHGEDLAEFLRGRKIINGISNYNEKASNGMGCLAAQLVHDLKDGIGGTYLYPTDAPAEEYDYTIRPDGDGGTILSVIGHGTDLFTGSPEDFDGEAIEAKEEAIARQGE